MSKKITYDNEPCLSENELFAYVQGNHDAAIERRVELHVADCEFCSDALDGLQNTDNQLFTKENQSIKKAIKEAFFPTKIISIFSKRNIGIAASVATLLTGFWWWNQPNLNETIAQKEIKQEPIVAEVKTKTDSTKVSETAIIALADENISPKKSKIKKDKNTQNLVLNDQNIGSNIIASGETNLVVVPNPTTGFSEMTITTVPSGESTETYTFDHDLAEKTPIKVEEKEQPKEDGVGNLKNSSVGADYKFYSDSSSVKNTDDAQKYVTHQNMYNPSKSIYPSMPPTPTKDIVGGKTDKESKKKEQVVPKPATKSKSNPKTNIEYSQADDKLLNEGIREYQKNRPRQAIEIFNRILDKNPQNESAIFYKGASQAIDNQCFDAVNTLQLFNNSYPEGSAANTEATWLIANCQLKLMQRESAVLLLKQLAEFYNPRQDDAKKLLEKL